MSLRSVLLGVACVAWCAGIVGGFTLAERYSGVAGAAGAPPATWPAEARLARDPARPTLVLFAHPHCPCTSATIGELARLLAHGGDRVATTVLFYADPRLGAEWSHTALRERASELPGVTVADDPLGEQARLFGARTSGQALLYGTDGVLLFAGGLTPARGHEGDNDGRAALQDLLLHGHGADHAPVFGCSLVETENQG